MPLAGYGVLLGAWTALFGGVAGALARRRALPRLGPGDVVLLGVSTHKLTRIVTKDWVTIPLRAPFTTYVASRGSGEVDERARGSGLRRAVGDLLTCNYCTGPWVAGALLAGMARAPRLTRSVASLFAAVAVSDFLHEAFENLRDRRASEKAAGEAARAAAERLRPGEPEPHAGVVPAH